MVLLPTDENCDIPTYYSVEPNKKATKSTSKTNFSTEKTRNKSVLMLFRPI